MTPIQEGFLGTEYISLEAHPSQIVCDVGALTMMIDGDECDHSSASDRRFRLQVVKVMISGAPVTVRYTKEMVADLYAPDASSAARLERMLVPQPPEQALLWLR